MKIFKAAEVQSNLSNGSRLSLKGVCYTCPALPWTPAMKPEDDAIAKLERAYPAIVQTTIADIRQFFDALRHSEDTIARVSPHELFEAQWALLGTISRAYQLMLCSVNQISDGNRSGFFVAARGLIESACSITWVNENGARLPSLVQFQGPAVGRMLNSGYRASPKLKELYSEFSGIAHPGRGTHLLGFQYPRKRLSRSFMSSFDMTVTKNNLEKWLNSLILVGQIITGGLQTLASNRDAITKGQVMARVTISPLGDV